MTSEEWYGQVWGSFFTPEEVNRLDEILEEIVAQLGYSREFVRAEINRGCAPHPDLKSMMASRVCADLGFA